MSVAPIGGLQPERPVRVSPPPRTEEPVDRVTLGSAPELFKVLQRPPAGTSPARNGAPVVVVHGTLAEAVDIERYHEAALDLGHPSDLTTYPQIRDGKLVKESARAVSETVNTSRQQVLRDNLARLEGSLDRPEELRRHFLLDRSPRAEALVPRLPDVVRRMKPLAEGSAEDFSTRAAAVEADLARELEPVLGAQAAKGAAELVESLAPRAILVGHSMGGFVAYALAVNPQGLEGADAGAGVGTALILSSPIRDGLQSPQPPGLSNWPFELVDRHVLAPAEALPPWSWVKDNPVLGPIYEFNKAFTKAAMAAQTDMWTALSLPFIYADKPGYRDVAEGSDFLARHMQGRPVPAGTSVVAITSPDDQVVEEHRSLAPDSPNAHNLSVRVPITSEDLRRDPKRHKGILAHRRMTAFPMEHQAEFREHFLLNPRQVPRLLDPANHDGMRWSCAAALLDEVSRDPRFLDAPEWKPALEALTALAREDMPFLDSPSQVAQKVLLARK